MDYILFLFLSIFSIIIYLFINYSLSILGYRTFGLTVDDDLDENSEFIDDDKVEVNFDKAGIKKVIGSYLKNKF